MHFPWTELKLKRLTINIPSTFSVISEADASELSEKCKEMFPSNKCNLLSVAVSNLQPHNNKLPGMIGAD